MNEERQALALIGLAFLVGVIGLFLTGGLPGVKGFVEAGDVYVDEYRADLYLNGTLEEQFVYRIKAPGKYRMLYRKWTMPLSTTNPSIPYIEPLKISSLQDFIPYFKERNGFVTVLSNQSKYVGEIQSLAELNEAGVYEPQKFSSGTFKVDYLFRIHPFLECDQKFCHWNLMLADEHLPYRQASIYIHDPGNLAMHLSPPQQ